MNLQVSRALIPSTNFHYLHNPGGTHFPRAFRVRKAVCGEIEVKREIVLRHDRYEQYSSSRERLREQAKILVDEGIIRVDLGRIDKALAREKAGMYRQCVAYGNGMTVWFSFDRAWGELIKERYLDEDGVIQPKFYQDHRATYFDHDSVQGKMQAAKKYFLDTAKLKALPLTHAFFQSLHLRSEDSTSTAEARHAACVEAVLGRFAARLEDVSDFIPTAENFYSLGGYFLERGLALSWSSSSEGQALILHYSQLAEECFQEAEKYESHPGWQRTCQSFVRNNAKMGHQAGKLLFLIRDILSRVLGLNDEDALVAFECFNQEYLEEILASIINFSRTAIDLPDIGSGSIIETYDEDMLTVIYSVRVAASFARSLAEFFGNLDKLIDFIRQLRAEQIIERPYLLAFQKLVRDEAPASPKQLIDLIRIELTQRRKALIAPLLVLANNPPCPEGHIVDAITTGSIDQPVPLAEFLSTRPTLRLLSSYEELIISAFGYTKEAGISESERNYTMIGDEWKNCLKMIRSFFDFLAEYQILPWAYINALLRFAVRFPEYQKKLNVILEREKFNILNPGHLTGVAIVPAELPLGFDISLQPVPLIEQQMAIQPTVKKCLVLDADETLWDGIIDEDGVVGGRALKGSSLPQFDGSSFYLEDTPIPCPA
jgi:hypothetical protein